MDEVSGQIDAAGTALSASPIPTSDSVIQESSQSTEDLGTLDDQTPADESTVVPRSGARSMSGGTRFVVVDAACGDLVREALAGAVSPLWRATVVDLDSLHAVRPASMIAKAAVVVLGGADSRLPSVETIAQLRSMHPQVGIYVIADRVAEVARQLPALAAAGVDEVFCRDVAGEVDAFRETLAQRVGAPAPATELRHVWKWFRDVPERALVMHCVRNAFREDNWAIRTKVFGACRRTLQNRVAGIGLPSPGLLARWGRVLHAQELERRGVEPATVVAQLIGLPSASALHRARRRVRKALMERGGQSLVFVSLLK